MRGHGRHLLAGLAIAVALLGVVADAASAAAKNPYSATIRRTAYGIPHITAKSYQGLGFGYGYAFAQDDICTMAETYVTVDAQRSRWFGPTGSYEQRGNGVNPTNLDSDFFYQQIIDSGVIDKLLGEKPPNGLETSAKQVVSGYVQGYNKYLSDVGGAKGIKDPACKGKPWVRPITEADAYRRFYSLIELASGDVGIPGIANAAPPTPSLPVPLLKQLSTHQTALELSKKLPIKAAGSNAVAVGRAGTRDKKHGLLLGNPHFPWVGPERFYQAQATIPGKFNASGASLFGVPAILIGHTRTVAWSHTVSTAYRFTPYQLTLVPGDPTAYLRDGKVVHMTSRDVTVQEPATGETCPTTSCALKPVTRTLYSAPGIGPVFTDLVGVPLPWTSAEAFAMRDANANNFRAFNHFFAMDRVTSTKGAYQVLKKYQGIPWVNTIVADKKGDALYADIGAIPNVPDSLAQQCNTALGTATTSLLGLPILDASRSACDWATDPDAREPGLFGPSHMPHLFRDDYVTNSNDSYWLSNPKQPLEGYARIIGSERTARTLRTRIGLIMTQSRVDGTDGKGPAGFTRADMQRMVFSNRQYGGELVRDSLVQMCRAGGGTIPSSNGVVPTGNACDVLAAWDLHENANSRGAILFRRFWTRALAAATPPWTTQFDANDPVNTPNGLDTSSPSVQQALGDAITDLNGGGIALDAAPQNVQYALRNGKHIPITGGPGDPNGIFNAIEAPWNGKSFDPVDFGSSYVQVVTWNDGPCPDARTILTYSESADPTRSDYADQTKLFSGKKWVKDLFCQKDVVRGTLSTTALAKGRKTKVSGRTQSTRSARVR